MVPCASDTVKPVLRRGFHPTRPVLLFLLLVVVVVALDSRLEHGTRSRSPESAPTRPAPVSSPATPPAAVRSPELANEFRRAEELIQAGRLADAVQGLVRHGQDLQERGQLGAARLCLERARSALSAVAAADTLDVTEALADIYIAQGFYNDARVILEGKLAAMTSPQVAATVDLMRLRYALARLLVRMGEYADAERLYDQAIAATDDPLQLAYLLNGLAILHDELGAYPKAQELYERSMGSAEKAADNRQIVGSILNNLGYLHKNIGDYSAAEQYYKRALQVHLTGRTESVESAMTLVNIADIYRLQHDFDRAEATLERALITLERILGPDHSYIATSLHDLAEIQLERGHPERARTLFERALRIHEATFGHDHVDTYASREGLAEVADMTGDDDAGRLYDEALATLEAAVGPDNPRCAEALRHVAWFRARNRQRSEALALAVRAETLSMENARLLASALPERQALRYASERPAGLHLALTVAADDRRDHLVQAAWDIEVRSRALVLDEIAARQRALRFDDPETERVAAAYAQASGRLAHLLLAASQAPESLPVLQGQIEEARSDRERWERELAARSPAFKAEESRRGLGLDAVRAALPPGAALVSFVRYERWAREAGAQRIHHGTAPRLDDLERCYLAFVQPASRGTGAHSGRALPAACLVPLGPAERIDRLVDAWSRELRAAPFARDRAQARASYRAASSEVRHAVWDPLADRLNDPDIVFVVPDGDLHRISFAALPLDEDRYLIESGLRFHYLAAERDLAARAPAGARTSGLLAIGGAAFDARLDSSPATAISDAPPLSAGATRFPPLPATAEEARSVAAAWQHAAQARPDAWPWSSLVNGRRDRSALVLTGADATEAAFKTLAPNRRVVHIATHGFFLDADSPQPAMPSNTRGIGAVVRSDPIDRPGSQHTNPLRLSGFALAGANRSDADDSEAEDGIVTAEEIAAMNLSGTEWAVLSACETGTGAVQDVEGIVGLRRAFQVAGVSTMVMSLWAVEDRTTRQWMEELYRIRFEEAATTLEAVQQASLSVLRAQRSSAEGEHPFYWAAFVAAGDWH